jgi:hypothetical protein
MRAAIRPVPPVLQFLLCLLAVTSLGACASVPKWASAGGNREQGVVRVSYEYPEFQQPEMSDTQAAALALDRCNGWGYRKAEPVDGLVRQCANVQGGNCTLWTVTREYQCSDGASRLATRQAR